jgi:glutaredoxin
MFEVITKPNCPYCTSAKYLLKKNNLLYHERVMGVNIDRDLILESWPTMHSFPIVTHNGILVGGYTDLLKYIDENRTTLDDGQQLIQE